LRGTIDVPDIGDDAVPLPSVNAADDGEAVDLVLHARLKCHVHVPLLPQSALREIITFLRYSCYYIASALLAIG
jgi:hypothetical protein